MGNVYDDVINGTFSQLQPSVAEMYAGIYPPASQAPAYQAGMMGRGQPASVGSPYLTAAEQQQLQQQLAQGQALQAQYGANGQPLPASVGIPQLPTAPTWGPFEQANYDARNNPNTWMAQSRMQAQALMRQRAVQQANAGGGAGPAASAQPGSVASPPSLPPPLTIQGTATGNSYNVGQTYQNGNGTYVANPDGTFTRIAGPAPAPANYAANGTRYSRGTDANGNNQSLTSGNQSNAGIGTDEKVALALSQAPSLAGKRAR